MRYAVKVRSDNAPTDNYSIMTFASVLGVDPPEVRARIAMRLATYFQALRDYNLVTRSETLEINAKAGANTLSVPFDEPEYALAVQQWNDSPMVQTGPFGGAKIDQLDNPFRMRGQAGSNLPIGTSVMIAEKTESIQGRCFVAYPHAATLAADTGKVQIASRELFKASHEWVTGLSANSGALDLLGVYSAKQDSFQILTNVSIKSEFSNLASRRR